MHIFIIALLISSQPYDTYQFTIGFKSMASCKNGIDFIAKKMDPAKRAEFIEQADCLELWVSREKMKALRDNEKNGILSPTGKHEKVF